MDTEDGLSRQRAEMVKRQLASRGIHDARVLAAMGTVPRHAFVPDAERGAAYMDAPLPIGQGQTISQPYIVAYMLQALALEGNEKVLEIGTGSGYQAALLTELVREVHTIERYAQLAKQAEKILTHLGYKNVTVHIGDGSNGLPEHAPYDAIVAAAGAPVVPQPMLEQLAPGGRLLLPVGELGAQILQLWRRDEGKFEHEDLVPVAFVPLVGEHGWESYR